MLNIFRLNRFLIIFLLLAIILSFNEFYLKSFSRYDISWNPNRLKIKIPIIETEWCDIDERKNFWLDINHVHFSKMLIIKSKFINLELDRYYLNNNEELHVINKYNRLTNRLVSSKYKIFNNKIGNSKDVVFFNLSSLPSQVPEEALRKKKYLTNSPR
jgi:hypothetical protein